MSIGFGSGIYWKYGSTVVALVCFIQLYSVVLIFLVFFCEIMGVMFFEFYRI